MAEQDAIKEPPARLRDAPATLVRNHPSLMMYAFIFLAVLVVVIVRVTDQNSFEARVCRSTMEGRLNTLDLVYGPAGKGAPPAPIDPTLPENVQLLIRQSQEQQRDFQRFAEDQIKIPPETCEGTGVDIQKIIDEHEPYTPPTTTAPPITGSGSAPTTETTEAEARASPSGGRPRTTTTTEARGGSAPSPTTTPTTAAPPPSTTTTTEPCIGGRLLDRCLLQPRSASISPRWWTEWKGWWGWRAVFR